MSPSPSSPGPPPPGADVPAELVGVRYSLPQLLAELRIDRATGAMASEKLDQVEIGKLFKALPPRRVKSPQ